MASSDQYLIGEVPFITWASYAKAQVKVTLRSSFIFLKGPSGVSGQRRLSGSENLKDCVAL